MDSWIYKVKTLPNRQPGFASGLCSMVCLWCVLIPAFILALKGSEFNLRQLIGPALAAIALATLLFSFWKKSALKYQYVKNIEETRDPNPSILVKRLDRLSQIGTNFQWTGIGVLMVAVATREMAGNYIANYNYASTIQGFAIFAILVFFVLSRLYAYTRKKLEKVQQLTEDEQRGLHFEHSLKFLWPHIFWGIIFAVFHWLVV